MLRDRKGSKYFVLLKKRLGNILLSMKQFPFTFLSRAEGKRFAALLAIVMLGLSTGLVGCQENAKSASGQPAAKPIQSDDEFNKAVSQVQNNPQIDPATKETIINAMKKSREKAAQKSQ